MYELLGVRFFKKYLLPDGFLLFRLRGKNAMQPGQGTLKAELKRLERETKRNELIHLLALLLAICFVLSRLPQLSKEQLLLIVVINLFVNVYPIFVQRYNRFRILRAECRREARRPLSRSV